MPERQPAHAIEAERAVLGQVLLNNEHYHEAAQLTADDFGTEAHRRIYACMVELAEDGQVIDLVTLTHRLITRGDLARVGGAAFVASLTDGRIKRNSIEMYLRPIREAYRMRQLLRLSESLSAGCRDAQRKSSDLMAEVQERLWGLQADDSRAQTRHILPIMQNALAELETHRTRGNVLLGLTTGLQNLDTATTGIRPSELWIVAGRTGEGKSCLATQIALANARQDTPVGIFAVEMSDRQTATRLAIQHCGVDAWKIRKAWLSSQELDLYRKAAAEIAQLPIYINDASNLSIREFDARARLMVKRSHVRLIIVDHIHEMTALGKDERERVTKIGEGLRQFAKNTGVPILAVAQMPRPRDGNPRTRPTKYDLKESGALEQKAHSVLLIYRPLQKGSTSLYTGEDEIVIAKQREGATGPERVTFNPATLRFEVRE